MGGGIGTQDIVFSSLFLLSEAQSAQPIVLQLSDAD
jgi:hypothetical protein